MAFHFLLTLLAWSTPFADPGLPNFDEAIAATDRRSLHTSWELLLKKYVADDGLVDYNNFRQDSSQLRQYLELLAAHAPDSKTAREEQLAYYINLYNAATVKLILDHYPVASIKDIRKPWDTHWIGLGTEQVSLGHIEHEILRKMNEPRIHFAINCASFSCPKLLNEAYTAEKLEQQLEQVTREFIRDPTRNRIRAEQLQLSQLFNWYKKDFTEQGSLLDYIAPYTESIIRPDARVSYLKYDWSLNETR